MHFELQQVSNSTVAVIDERLASNAAAIILDDFIIAVDVTMRPDASRLFRTMLEDKYRRPVRYLCITHYHGDHVFGLKPYKDTTIFASAPIAANMRSRMSTDWTPEAFEAWKNEDPEVAKWADDVELIIPPLLFHHRIDILGNDRIVEFHHAGGHTSCSAYAYDPTENILFAGDLIFAGEVPYAGDETCDPEEWMAVLRAWLDLEIAKVVPGHGPLADVSEIEKHLEFFERLKRAALDAIEAGKGYAEIMLPDVYPVEETTEWVVERTQKLWHEYYSKEQTAGGLSAR
jgi:glyoxylase-like metal-dependent hydrolase (beta-lactamase superfamily II)